MKNKSLFNIAAFTGGIGLIIIFGVILSGTSYPDLFFRIGVPLGLLFVFISVILGFLCWLRYLRDTIKSKHYAAAIVVAVLGLFIIARELIKILWSA